MPRYDVSSPGNSKKSSTEQQFSRLRDLIGNFESLVTIIDGLILNFN